MTEQYRIECGWFHEHWSWVDKTIIDRSNIQDMFQSHGNAVRILILSRTNCTIMLINFIVYSYYISCIINSVKPPVGIPGKDVFYVPNYCDNCNKHFLINAEFKIHKMNC